MIVELKISKLSINLISKVKFRRWTYFLRTHLLNQCSAKRKKMFNFSVELGFGIGLGLWYHYLVVVSFGVNLTRWSRVLRDTAASQLNDISR